LYTLTVISKNKKKLIEKCKSGYTLPPVKPAASKRYAISSVSLALIASQIS